MQSTKKRTLKIYINIFFCIEQKERFNGMLLLFSEIGWGPGTAVILFMLLTWYHVTFDIFGVWTVYMFNFKLLPQMEQERRSLLL